ncbi:hypothetical protein ASE91_11125 [Sphingomonas sp. Leaf62]|nr:hypothetical protein ASE91_11125 [Sphingomonas sp. Leaf62]
MRQERSAALTRLRQARAEAKAEVADRIAEARVRREFEAGEREMDAAIRRLSKQVRVRPEPRRSSSSARPSRLTAVRAGHSGVIVTRNTTSALARRDRLGREGIMLRIRYVRAGGRHASPGCLRRHWRYIAREAAVTLDSDGREIVLSNIGETIDDVADALGLQEQVLREMRKNAKLGFRMIGAFPYGMPVDARREVLQRLGDELFGTRDLPWSAAAHEADPDAKVDNPHFHLDYGLLPMARQADGSFIVSNDLRTDLDGQEGLRFIRHTVARVMTEVAQKHGLDRSFTALSYRERGMGRDGGEHVGQEGTAAHRRGEHVATIARNEAKQRRAEAEDRAHRARERLAALEHLKRAIAAVPASPFLETGLADLSDRAIPALVAAPVAVDYIALSDIPGMTLTPSIVPVEIRSATTITASQLGDSPPAFAVVRQPAPIVAPSPPANDIPWSIPSATPSPVLPTLITAPVPAPAMPSTPSFAVIAPSVPPGDGTIPLLTASETTSSAPSLPGVPLVVDVQHDTAPSLPSNVAPLAIMPQNAAPSLNQPRIKIVADVVNAPLIAASPPVMAFVAAPDVVAGPAGTAEIGVGAPIAVAPPAIAHTNPATSHMTTMDVPCAELPSAPYINALPVLAQVGRRVAGVAAIGFPDRNACPLSAHR